MSLEGIAMNLTEELFKRASEKPVRIAFPEANEDKILQAIQIAKEKNLCIPVLLGIPKEIQKTSDETGISLDGFEIVDVSDEEWLMALIEEYCALQPLNSQKTMKRKSANYLYIALMMQETGRVDTVVGGYTLPSSDFHRAVLETIGMQDGFDTISSFCLTEYEGYEGSEGHKLAFGDCVVCENPNAEQLANMSIGACEAMKKLLGWEPRCGLLSYSTCGSTEGMLVEKVIEAVRIANEKRPDLAIDGEFQFDAAVNPKVAEKKVKRESRVAGRANIVLFPTVEVGNIAVKMLQAFCGMDSYLIMMGFRRPVMDCSRSSPVSETVGNIAIACIMAQGE